MALTDHEKARTRYHLGYPNVQQGAGLSAGIPTLTQPAFLLETAMGELLSQGEEQVRAAIGVLDGIDTKLIEAQDRLAAASLGDLQLRGSQPGQTEPDLLEREYLRWAGRLADIMAVTFYPYSHRFTEMQNRAGNIPHIH